MDYITNAERLNEVAAELGDTRIIAVDTEAAGYHRYLDRICLVQLSTRTRTYVVDALVVEGLDPLKHFFADLEVEVVFHDADYDLRLLQRDFGIVTRGLFDSKIAAQFLGAPAIGLANLVEAYLGVRMEKKHQRADWAKRPLPPELVEYAAEDTRYLPALRDRLREELIARGRLAWAEEEFRIQESVRWDPQANGEDAFLRLKGTRDLRGRQLAALRELHSWREHEARRRDVAPFRIMANQALIETARRMPAGTAGLVEIPGVSPAMVRRRGHQILAALERARSLPEHRLPERPRGPRRPPPDPELDATVERLKSARDEAAAALGLDRGFLMPRQQLEIIARAAPRNAGELAAIPEVRGWQVEALGDELLAALHA